MYKIIGADRREYGPVSADQVLKWIAEGRANGQTRARVEGGGDWKSLAEFTEFAAALAAQAPPPPAAEPPLMIRAQPQPAEAAAFGIGDCLGRAWELYQSRFIVCFGATAVIILLSVGLGSIHSIGAVVHAVLGFALWGGLQFMFLRLIRGQTADVGDAFAGFKGSLVALMLASLVAHVLTGIGFILLILPGLYLLTVWWMFTPMLIIDRQLDFWPAMELSRKTVNRNWWPCFGLLLLTLLIALAGAVVCGVGLFFTLPISLITIGFAYERLFGRPSEAAATVPPVPAKPTPTVAVEPGAKAPAATAAAESRESGKSDAPPIPDLKPVEPSVNQSLPEKQQAGPDPGAGTNPGP